MIVIIDYGMGNLGSVMNMLKKIGAQTSISSEPVKIAHADKLILPGVGAYDNGMQNLSSRGLVDILNDKVLNERTPILGICLGAQLLTRSSEEGTLPGLGWIDAESVRFQFPKGSNNLKIPHMGWNEISIKRENNLLCGFEDKPRFYFVHSYYLKCANSEEVIATSIHGIEFAAAVNKGNIWGTQFHPEKSHQFGLRVIKNFCAL
ncbi:MAG: imidazole glycerol phosphate synthase subunit HisH [Syntrophales bacterium LBB04]|nr:imidazole glycerol phosphate synthase subunit HisH [Syntrophales bacterium LBB04]